MAATKTDLVARIAEAVKDVFGGGNSVQEVSWPLYIRAAQQQGGLVPNYRLNAPAQSTRPAEL
jgi:hypothetical protein